MCRRGQWADLGFLWDIITHRWLADVSHGTIDEGKVLLHGACAGKVDGLTEGAYHTGLADDTHGTVDEGKVSYSCMVHV